MRGTGFVIAIVAGIAAVVLHVSAITAIKSESRIPSTGFAAVQHDYAVGEIIGQPNGDTNLKPTELFFQVLVPDSAKVPGVPISQIDSVLGQAVTRPLKRGDMLFLQDLAPESLELALANRSERALFVSLDGVTFEPSLLKVGSEVGFVVEADGGDELDAEDEFSDGAVLREIGPFRLLSIGDQVAFEATGKSPIITVVAEVDDERRLDEQSDQLIAAQENRSLRALTIYPSDLSTE